VVQGYNGRDSLLLPVILGGALLVLLLAVCICYTLRRRRQKTLRRQTIGVSYGEMNYTSFKADDRNDVCPCVNGHVIRAYLRRGQRHYPTVLSPEKKLHVFISQEDLGPVAKRTFRIESRLYSPKLSLYSVRLLVRLLLIIIIIIIITIITVVVVVVHVGRL
jgi:hypothetical protein